MEEKKIKVFNDTLKENNIKIVCAESITAGLLASTIASISGASEVLAGSIVTYNWDFKTTVLGVNLQTLEYKSAESVETTAEMCNGVMRLYPSANLFVAVTGMASKPGPEYPGTAEVGQIFVVIWYKGELYRYEEKFGELKRNTIREKTVDFIFEKILSIINPLV